MVDRRLLLLTAIPFYVLGGAILRTKDRVLDHIDPYTRRKDNNDNIHVELRPTSQYYWTDGHQVWYSGYDVPPDAKNVTTHFVVFGVDHDLTEYTK